MREKILKAIFVCAFLAVLSASVQAAPVIFGGSEAIIKVADFPNTEDYEYRRGEYIDAGYIYRQIHIFFIPVWNYDGRWVGYVGKDDTYLELKKEELDLLAEKGKVKLPETPSLPFWDSIGGKIVFGLILLLYLGWKILLHSSGSDESLAEGT